jgi:hypothetical protein
MKMYPVKGFLPSQKSAETKAVFDKPRESEMATNLSDLGIPSAKCIRCGQPPLGNSSFCGDCTKLIGAQHSGCKDDQDKTRWDLLPPDALEEIAKVLTFGANKYNDRNWEKGMKWHRPFGALMRHMWAWWRGQGRTKRLASPISPMQAAACSFSSAMNSVQLVKMTGQNDQLF